MTVKFKGVDLESDLALIIPHVPVADAYGGALQNLQSVWDSLTLLGQLSGVLGKGKVGLVGARGRDQVDHFIG